MLAARAHGVFVNFSEAKAFVIWSFSPTSLNHFANG